MTELSTSGAAAAEHPVLRLEHNEDRRIRGGHLWIFSNEVDTDATPLTGLTRGAIVQVRTDRDQFLGYAYVNPNALICARILAREADRVPGRGLFARRLRTALALRERLHVEPYYRLAFGESDGLPGLVLDRYGDIVVGQIATAGMEVLRDEVAAAVSEVIAPRALVWKNDSGARELEQLPKCFETAFGEVSETLEVREGNLTFTAPLRAGQKTGWFYDQAANRALLRRFLWPGARVLDVCSYAGAWAVTAMARGAGAALCVDASETALGFAARNAAANGLRLETLRADAFDALQALGAAGRRFDVVVLDPPAFVKRRKDLARGQAAYRKLNQLALNLIDRDGLLVSCSCSWHLPAEELVAIIQAAARHTGRFVQILAAGGQSPDHPVHPAIPETRYLKAFFCRVVRE